MAKPSEKNQTEQQSGQQIQPTQKSGLQKSESNLPRRGWTPFSSMFSMSPRDFFTANPFDLMRHFADEMDRNWGLWQGSQGTGIWSPSIEVFERGGKLTVRAELPGMDKDDVKIDLTDD